MSISIREYIAEAIGVEGLGVLPVLRVVVECVEDDVDDRALGQCVLSDLCASMWDSVSKSNNGSQSLVRSPLFVVLVRQLGENKED